MSKAVVQPIGIMILALLYLWHGVIGSTDILLAAILAELVYAHRRADDRRTSISVQQ